MVETLSITNFQEAREYMVEVQSKLTAEAINDWNERCQNPDSESAIQYANGIQILLGLSESNKKSIQLMKDQLKMWEGSLMSHNWVVGWEHNGLTVECEFYDHKNHRGKFVIKETKISADAIPVLWTEEDAKTLAEVVKNGHDQAPSCYPKRKWLEFQIKRLENMGKNWETKFLNP